MTSNTGAPWQAVPVTCSMFPCECHTFQCVTCFLLSLLKTEHFRYYVVLALDAEPYHQSSLMLLFVYLFSDLARLVCEVCVTGRVNPAVDPQKAQPSAACAATVGWRCISRVLFTCFFPFLCFALGLRVCNTQLLGSTNFWFIALSSSIIFWSINSCTNWFK